MKIFLTESVSMLSKIGLFHGDLMLFYYRTGKVVFFDSDKKDVDNIVGSLFATIERRPKYDSHSNS